MSRTRDRLAKSVKTWNREPACPFPGSLPAGRWTPIHANMSRPPQQIFIGSLQSTERETADLPTPSTTCVKYRCNSNAPANRSSLHAPVFRIAFRRYPMAEATYRCVGRSTFRTFGRAHTSFLPLSFLRKAAKEIIIHFTTSARSLTSVLSHGSRFPT